MHNYFIFLDKLYLKTDCNVIGKNKFDNFKSRFFSGLAHVTDLKFCLDFLQNYTE